MRNLTKLKVRMLSAVFALSVSFFLVLPTLGEQPEDVVDCATATVKFEVILCSNHGAFDLINWMHQMIQYAPDVDAAKTTKSNFEAWFAGIGESCMARSDLRLASDCLYDEASGPRAAELTERINSLYDGESDIEGEECDGCLDTALEQSPPTPFSPLSRPSAPSVPETASLEPQFGDNSSEWANDGECDDPRFEGSGMAEELTSIDRMRDAIDCRATYESGTITLTTPTAVAAASSTNDGSLIGEHFKVDYFRELINDWKQRGGLERYTGDINSFFEEKTVEIDTPEGSLSIFLKSDGIAILTKDQIILGNEHWHEGSDVTGEPMLCVEIEFNKYCSYVYLFTTDFVGSAKLVRADNNDGTSFNYWDAIIISGQSQDILAAMAAEPARQTLRAAGVDPAEYDELVNLYSGYQGAAICNQNGAQFDDSEIESLQRGAKLIEQKIGDEPSISAAWEKSAPSGKAARLTFELNYGKGVEMCQGLRFFLQGYLNENLETPAKPF